MSPELAQALCTVVTAIAAVVIAVIHAQRSR